ncbi:MBL fold metallo-hydrolase [Nocardiopsis halotolerans]|uniref:MBL fold metallo-hydrolase n=1 Tax=Nocardiopsis halotolerans TaxID=124252 RepID=UPI00034BE950|nr:MBL fold metallo-hydrolase [Nocardiopsis halotolerans]
MTGAAARAAAPWVEEVAEGVHAHIQPDGGWCLNNSGVVVFDGGAVVIDTAATERRATALRRTVDALAPGPRRIVVNTHHHGDHVFGNFVFGDSAEVIAHERAVAEVEDTGLALTRLWPDVDWGDIRLVLPTMTFTDRLDLRLGDRVAELHHVGPAHTTNDVVVWLPDERVLFTGDTVLSGCTPFTLMGSVSGTLETMERLRGFGARVLVCGHGPVCGPEAIDLTTDYTLWLRNLARRGHERGWSPLETAFEADLGPHADLIDPERIVGNLHRAYAELDGAVPGAPLDVLTAFREMVDYNGGRLPTCLA